jgi:phosphopantetheinyl transferase
VEGLAVAIAFPPLHPMGLDLEAVDRDRVATVKSEVKLLPEEAQWLQSGLAPEPAALIMLWTIREALGKVLRCGIGCPLEQLGVNQISSPDTAGIFHGNYQSFPAYQCIAWVMANRVITIALPKSLIRPSKNPFLP